MAGSKGSGPGSGPSAEGGPSRPVPSRDESSPETEARARAILAEAEAAAEALLAEAREEVQRLIREAAEAGQQEGFAEAEHLREQIAGLEQRMVKEIEGEVVRAALKVAAELLEAELAVRPEAVVDVVRTALQAARDARDVFLRINPRDANVLREHKSRLIDALGRARDVDVREDRKVRPGGVLVQTEAGVIDAQLETQLEEIARVLGA